MKKWCRKRQFYRSGKGSLALLMSVCLIGTMTPVTARAESGSTENGLCEHHTEHTIACGYVASAEGHECEHVHDDSCGYQEERACAHVHGEECGYVEASEGSPCTFVCDTCGEEKEQEESITSDETLTAQTQVQTADKFITAWQWIDEDEYLDEETGNLALPGASEERPAYVEDVTAFLPTQIQATIENTEDTEAEATAETITLGDWNCEEYPQAGAYTGSYTFAAALPEGYALSEAAEALTVLVELGGAQVYVGAEGHSYNNGFCTGYQLDESGKWVNKTGEEACTDEKCCGYEPAEVVSDTHFSELKDQYPDYYTIENAGQLYWFAGLVNGDSSVCTGGVIQSKKACAVLTADITVNTGNTANAVANCGGVKENGWRDWTPIGNSSNYYTGTFDGQGHTISGLYFNNSSTDDVGLFGYKQNGTVSNVGVVDSYFCGQNNVGGVCGQNVAGTITNCYSSSAVSGWNYVGGVCGYNRPSSTITNCYSSGTVSGSSFVGGVCGSTAGYSNIVNCYYDNQVCSASKAIGSLNTGASVEAVEGKTTDDFKSGMVAWLLQSRQKQEVWGQNLAGANGEAYPVLGGIKVYKDCGTYSNVEGGSLHLYDTDGVCTQCQEYQKPAMENNVYQIGNRGNLYWFAGLVNGTLDGIPKNVSANAVLTADITVNENVLDANGALTSDTTERISWTPIGNPNSFNGTFDGQGHAISGLYFNESSKNYVGLFSQIYEKGKVSNVGIVDSYFQGSYDVGGICGYNWGSITNCYHRGTVSGSNERVGGICGSSAGNNAQNIATITNCYHSGTVSGSQNVGGVCGKNNSLSNIVNCYYDSSVYPEGQAIGSDSGSSEAVEGKTTEQFQSGEVCYLLNSRISDHPVWYQSIEGETAETYPVFDITHGIVYASTPCTSQFSNTSGKTEEHSYILDSTNNAKHTCEKCGDTHDAEFTVNETENSISSCCTCGGTVTLAAPDSCTYDGTQKPVTVTGSLNGFTSTIDYNGEQNVPVNAGTYTASMTYTISDVTYKVSVIYTIEKAASSAATVPSEKTGLTYNGSAQDLVAAGSIPTGGTWQYSTSQNGAYTTSIPTGTDAQQYSVWYKVVGDENHNDTEPAEITVTIAPLEITNDNTTITTGTALTYTGAEQTQTLTGVTCGGLPVTYTVSGNTGTNAGNYTLTVTGTGNFTGTATQGFSISKHSCAGSDQTLLVKTGPQKSITYDLSKLLPEGVTGTTTYAVGTVTDENGVLHSAPADTDISDGKLTLQVASGAAIGKTATVPITFTNDNHEISAATLTVQIIDKTPVTLSGVTCGSRVYNGTAYAYAGTPLWKTEEGDTATGETTVTYYKADDTQVTAPTNAGSYRAVFTITSDDYVGTVSYNFEITKAVITVAAKDRNIYTGDAVPDLTTPTAGTDYTVTGLCGTDALSGAAIMSYEQEPDHTKTGTYTILISGLTAPEGDNYTLTFTNGTLTVTTKPSGGGSTVGGSDSGEASGGSAGGTEENKTEGSDNTTTITNGDGSITTTKTETDANGNTVTTSTTVEKDGSATEKVQSTEKNAEGKDVEVTTTTKTDADGNVTGVTQKSVIDNIAKNTTATVTVKTDGDGNVSSAKASVTKTADSPKVSLSGKVLDQIAGAAGAAADVRVTLTVKDNGGKIQYKVQADRNEIIPGETLYIFKMDTKTGTYTMVDDKAYKVSKAGNVTVNMKKKATYELVTAKESKAITKEILATVKPAKSSKSLSEGKKTAFAFSDKLDMDNVKRIIYETSQKSIVTVSKNGTITAIKDGIAIVKATVTLKNGKKKTVKMKIIV